MFQRKLIIAGVMALATGTMRADFSYQETTRITGGAMVGMMKALGVFSSQARQITEPMQGTVALKGDRMVHRTPAHISIVDLKAETITSVDVQRKTYTVMTFEQMKQMLEQMQQRMQQQQQQQNGQAQMDFQISVESTGKTRQINGADAKETVIKMEAQGTDQKSGQTGGMTITVDSWTIPGEPGYREVREFYKRMAEKINWTPGSSMFMTRPDVVRGMSEVYKQSAAMDGVPVLQMTTMGASGTAPADGSAPQQSQPQPSARPSITGALGGKFGLGRKKSEPPPQQQSAGGSSASGVLLEMTTERSAFSAVPVNESLFDIPAGFKQVENEMMRRAK